MKKKSTIFGLVLIVIGALWMFANLGYINISYETSLQPYLNGLFELWSLILVIIGTFLLTKNKYKRAAVIILSIALVVLYTELGPNIWKGIADLAAN